MSKGLHSYGNRSSRLPRHDAGRSRQADHEADSDYGQWANPECLRCRGRGWVGAHEPCPVCIVGVWG